MSATNESPILRRTWLARLWGAVRGFFRPAMAGQVVTRMGTRPSP